MELMYMAIGAALTLMLIAGTVLVTIVWTSKEDDPTIEEE